MSGALLLRFYDHCALLMNASGFEDLPGQSLRVARRIEMYGQGPGLLCTQQAIFNLTNSTWHSTCWVLYCDSHLTGSWTWTSYLSEHEQRYHAAFRPSTIATTSPTANLLWHGQKHRPIGVNCLRNLRPAKYASFRLFFVLSIYSASASVLSGKVGLAWRGHCCTLLESRLILNELECLADNLWMICHGSQQQI